MPGPYHVSLQAPTPGRADGPVLPGTLFLKAAGGRGAGGRCASAEPSAAPRSPWIPWEWDLTRTRGVILHDDGATAGLLRPTHPAEWPGAMAMHSSVAPTAALVLARRRRPSAAAAAAAADEAAGTVQRFAWTVSGTASAVRSTCVGVCHPSTAGAPGGGPPWGRPASGWGLLWAAGGSVFRLGKESPAAPVARTPPWGAGDELAIAADATTGSTVLTVNGAVVLRASRDPPSEVRVPKAGLVPCCYLRAPHAMVTLTAPAPAAPPAAPAGAPLPPRPASATQAARRDRSPERRRRVITVGAWRRQVDNRDDQRSAAGALSALRELRDLSAAEDSPGPSPSPAAQSPARALAPLSSVGRQREWAVPPVFRAAAAGVGLRGGGARAASPAEAAELAELAAPLALAGGLAAETVGRRERYMYRLWAEAWAAAQKDFLSTAVVGEVVLRQMHNATAALPRPSALRTAVSCLVLERVLPACGRVAGIIRCALSEVYRAVYSDYGGTLSPEEAADPLYELEGDCADRQRHREPPNFIAMRTWQDSARRAQDGDGGAAPPAAEMVSRGLARHAGHVLDDTDLLGANPSLLDSHQLKSMFLRLQERLREARAMALRAHFTAWRHTQRSGQQQEQWGDIMHRAKYRIILDKYFAHWRKRFALRRAAAASGRMASPTLHGEPSFGSAGLVMGSPGLPRSLASKAADTRAQWEALKKPVGVGSDDDDDPQRSGEDALGLGDDEQRVSDLDLTQLLHRWVEACIAVHPEVECHGGLRNFSSDFVDGRALLCVVLVVNDKAVIGYGSTYRRLDSFFSSPAGPPNIVYDVPSHLQKKNETMNTAVVAALYGLWILRCQDIVSVEPNSKSKTVAPLRALSKWTGIAMISRAWAGAVRERLRLHAAGIYLQPRRTLRNLAPALQRALFREKEDTGRGGPVDLGVNVEIKELLVLPPVRRVLSDSKINKVLGDIFTRAADGDQEITLGEWVQLLRALGWLAKAGAKSRLPSVCDPDAEDDPSSSALGFPAQARKRPSHHEEATCFLAIEDVHAVFELCQGASEGTDAAGGDGDATIDFSEYQDACVLVSGFWWQHDPARQVSVIGTPDSPGPVEEIAAEIAGHARWFFENVLIPQAAALPSAQSSG
eukprot:TRINITY_DN6305_c0_g5_i1.p1 TRINITY_DN6305_c0_g5~~TRINITY_DN6305_c0_g5_i1.p1  ORF type:complete len:1130 (+),score=292.24 TRINITY_DN6305_c0_g5_i1:80-3469(+)